MSSQPVEKDPYEGLPHLRLLYCLTCGTIDEIPDYEGRPSEDDQLNYVIDTKHNSTHTGQMFRLPIGFWIQDEYKAHIIEQIRGGGSKGLAEIDPTFYDVRNTFKEDALSCYQKHLRPTGACPDYMSDKKILRPDTKAERKEAGLPLYPTGPKAYLCQSCPVRAFYDKKERGE